MCGEVERHNGNICPRYDGTTYIDMTEPFHQNTRITTVQVKERKRDWIDHWVNMDMSRLFKQQELRLDPMFTIKK